VLSVIKSSLLDGSFEQRPISMGLWFRVTQGPTSLRFLDRKTSFAPLRREHLATQRSKPTVTSVDKPPETISCDAAIPRGTTTLIILYRDNISIVAMESDANVICDSRHQTVHAMNSVPTDQNRAPERSPHSRRPSVWNCDLYCWNHAQFVASCVRVLPESYPRRPSKLG
jgi:hypothetical protein